MTKKGLSLALFALLAITAHGQRFDWARTIDGYDQSSSNVANKIVGSMTDRGGNLYICAQYGWGATLCGANLPDGGENGNMVVAKISPDGGMVWHKEIYGYRTTGGTAVGLLPMGDTAMMVCYKLIAPGYQEWIDVFGTRYGWQNNDFDSLFTGSDSLRFNHLYLTCFSTFTLDGEITSTHYLTRACLDTKGNPFTGADMGHPADSLKILVDENFAPNALTMDGEGNIILTRMASESVTVLVPCDTCVGNRRSATDSGANFPLSATDSGANYNVPMQLATWNGGVGGVRYYVDGRRIYDFEVPFRAENWNVQMLKLTPSLDSVLFCQYLAYDTVGHGVTSDILGNFNMCGGQSLACDRDGNIYLCGTVESPLVGELLGDTVVWDSTDHGYHTVEIYDTAYYRDILLDSLRPDLRIHTEHGQMFTAYLLKYSPDGTLLWVHQPRVREEWEAYPYTLESRSSTYYSLMMRDEDSSLYILGDFCPGVGLDTTHYQSINFGLGDTAWHRHKGAGFVRLRAADGGYLGSGCAPAPDGAATAGTLAVQENHVVMQVKYSRQLVGVDTVYQHHFPGDLNGGSTLAIVHFDNEGHLQNVIDLGNDDDKSRTGQCLLRDSVLYLTGALASNAYLGDITLYAGNNKSYIIKYVDTAFMTPYVYVAPPVDTTDIDPVDTGDVSVTVVDNEGTFVAYPNPFRQRVTIDCSEPVAETAWLTDLTGRREQVRLIPQGHSSDNAFTPARPQGAALSTAEINQISEKSHNQTYTLDLTARPQAIYLLTITTASGKTHTVRLMKQSDIFSR